MKKILSFILLATISVGTFATAYYCDPNTTEDGEGLSWDDAASPALLHSALSMVENNDTIFFKGGTIYVTQASERWDITKSYVLIGGFDPAATGTVTKLPDYPSATPTVFSGDANKNGKPDKGDYQALIRVDFSGDTNKVFTMIGFDLVNTYYEGEKESSDDVKTSTAESAALRVMCGKAFVRNCHFYNHVTPDGRGSQCVTSVGAKLHMTDCELHDCVSMTRGSLLRSRQFFIDNESTKPINPECVLERCALYNGNNMGGDTMNTAGFYGGAAQISYGPFYAINTTIANSNAYSDGGGLNFRQSSCLISCTLANSRCKRAYKTDEAADSRNTYGSNLHTEADGKLFLANSMVLGPDDNSNKQYATLYSGTNTKKIGENFQSGGYNITGTYYYYKGNYEEIDQSESWQATDKYIIIKNVQSVQYMADYLGANPQMTDNGGCSKTMVPLAMQNGDNVAHLQQLADSLFPKWTKVDASVDQRGYQRDAKTTCVGAMAMEAKAPAALTNPFTVHGTPYTKYLLNGQIVVEKNGKRYTILGSSL